MVYEKIRKELTHYYFDELPAIVEEHRVRVYGVMDAFAALHPDADSYFLKAKLYDTIAENVTPRVFDDIPFCFELGTLLPGCDGRYNRTGEHANGWLINRNMHLYEEFDPQNYADYQKLRVFFSQCGTYSDYMHLGIPMKKLFKCGLLGILDELKEARLECTTQRERNFIDCARAGIEALQKIALKLSDEARKKGKTELAEIIARVPNEAPKSFKEGLSVLAFIRKALGSLEGYGFSSMGRPDLLLRELYLRDVERGVSEDEMLDLVSRFLLIWDATNDRRKRYEKVTDHELENTITLGGCDEEGKEVFNGVTRLFITARDRLNCIYPKMMLRFSESSSAEYLALVTRSLCNGKSYSLYQNDDVTVPSLLKMGAELSDARNYVVGGCWDVLTPDTNNKFSGEYLHLTIPFIELMKKGGGSLNEYGLEYVEFEKVKSFDELYSTYMGVVKQIAERKHRLQNRGSQIWDKVNPACALSALMEPCIKMKRDMTSGGIKYSRESIYFACFAEIVDSLYAIKLLCFGEDPIDLSQLLWQCNNDWPDEQLRRRAIDLPSFGDGSEESSRFAAKVFDDLNSIAEGCETAYGGKCRAGYNLYTEIVTMAEDFAALPNGRKAGAYTSQGITPSRLQKENSLYDFIDSYRYIDFKNTPGNSSVTLTLPAGRINESHMSQILVLLARGGLQAIQPSVVDKEILLKAKKDPQNYGDVIVRVCGFSAPFVCLKEKYQDEIISRNIFQV